MKSYSLWNGLIRFGLISLMLTLNGCTRNIHGNFCLLYEPIYLDLERDSPYTIKQVDRNNILFETLCEAD